MSRTIQGVRARWTVAARSKPAIVFIDEVDCLGKNRKYDTNGEMQQTNNALLAANVRYYLDHEFRRSTE